MKTQKKQPIRLTLHAKPSTVEEGTMVLFLYAGMSDRSEAAVKRECARAANQLKPNLNGIRLENLNDFDPDILEAVWYAEDDWVAPEITSRFNLSEVFEAIQKELRTSTNWQRTKPMGKGKKAQWQLTEVLTELLPIEPYEDSEA